MLSSAQLDKLAGEYADELANLGVRVSNLEKKVGNLSFSGDGRMRYQNKDAGAADKWDGRIRLNVKDRSMIPPTYRAALMQK